MIRICLCLLLIGCAETPEPAPPPPPPPVAAAVVTPPPRLPQIIDLSNDVIIVELDCDDPAVHCREDEVDDIPARVVHDDLVVVAGDRDGDSVPDATDKCPDDPEDVDGFQDTDGCPDPDVDRDRAIDVHDRCPYVSDDADDNDGCPEPAPAA